jgi:tetratricopeptide (TPR) repeat protein
VIASDPADTDSRASLIKLYMAQGKRAEAEEFSKQVKRELPDNSAAYRMLGDLYFAVGDLDRAVSEYESLYSEHPKDLQVVKNYVQLLILKNRLDEASKLNEGVLKSKPKDDEALTFRGEIQIAQGKLNEAVQTLQSVVSGSPDNAVAHYQLGIALSRRSELDRAGKEWQEAARLRPDMVEAQRELAKLALQKGDMAGLEQAASQIISRQPGSPDGYAMRSFSFMARKQFAAAEQDARKATEVAPQSAAGYLEMGNLRTREQKFSEAETWYKQSLSRDPNSTDALLGIVNIYLAQKQPDKAIAAANAQIALSPKNSGFYDLLGAVMMSRKDYGSAQTALMKAVELNKNNADAYAKLCQAQAISGALDQAIATCNNGVRDNPKEAGLYILMGSLYEAKHDLEKAKSAYTSALQIRRDDPVASNNLAYVLLETGGNADMALQLAQTARRSLPGLSNVADTLGWAFYQKGVYQSAIDLFQEAIKLAAKNKEPDSPLYHYHLGLAYAKSDQPALARQHLERVLKLDPKYSDADEVRKQLAQLKS